MRRMRALSLTMLAWVIAGQRSYGCEVDALNLPVFPPECDEICVE